MFAVNGKIYQFGTEKTGCAAPGKPIQETTKRNHSSLMKKDYRFILKQYADVDLDSMTDEEYRELKSAEMAGVHI